MSEELRPIGDTYWHRYAPMMSSTDLSAHEYLYRVTAHVEVSPFPGGPTHLAESLEPIDHRQYRPTGYLRRKDGAIVMTFEDGSEYTVGGSGWTIHPLP